MSERSLRLAWPVACLLVACLVPAAADARQRAGEQVAGEAASEPVGAPVPDKVLRDPEFGVTSRQFGLERTVEMYQWHRAGEGYFAGWSLEPVDSAGFAPGRENPGRFPLQSDQWRALQVTLDGHPVAPAAVARLGTWRPFRPGFSALPGNLSATFQPEGDGLGSSENPLDPQVGDLRVTWRELVLPPLQGRVLLRDGVWTLPADAAGNTASSVVGDDGGDPAADPGGGRWAMLGGALLLVLGGWLAFRRRQSHRPPPRTPE